MALAGGYKSSLPAGADPASVTLVRLWQSFAAWLEESADTPRLLLISCP